MLEDDSQSNGEPKTQLDFGLPIWRVTEALVAGMAFSKAMGCTLQETKLNFCFRWTGLKNRKLTSWASNGRHIWSGRESYDDEILSEVLLPMDIPNSSLYNYVHIVLKPLYEVFDGFDLNIQVIKEIVDEVLQRR